MQTLEGRREAVTKGVVVIPSKREAKGKRQEISEEMRRWADNVIKIKSFICF
jgi:hypothetical protein